MATNKVLHDIEKDFNGLWKRKVCHISISIVKDMYEKDQTKLRKYEGVIDVLLIIIDVN